MIGLLIAIVAGIVSFEIAALIRKHAIRLGVVAEVNERSSHKVPTPSGGGLGIVAGGSLAAACILWLLPGGAFMTALLAMAMAAVGFIDDRGHVPPAIRLAVQAVLVGVMVWTLQPVVLTDAIDLPVETVVLVPLLTIGGVYWVNVFNFMDGIDGIAASQAVFMLGAAIWLALLGGASPASPLLWWLGALVGGTIGFLLLNWPPARVFMGDAGSTFLGFMIAYAALATIVEGWLTLWQWLILTGLFVADATVTLGRRALRRENIFAAHRMHAYQHLSRRWKGHRPVTLLAIALNVGVLLPLATTAASPATVAVTYVGLGLLVLIAGAGAREPLKSSS